MAQNYGLGRGLSSLIPQKKPAASADSGDAITEPRNDFNYFGSKNGESAIGSVGKKVEEKNRIQEVEIFRIVPNPHQPRLNFDEEKLKELTLSIKEHGILQPIVVSAEGDQFEIIAGERRFQAAKLAGLKTVPVISRTVTDQQKLELAIIENIQRHDLNSIEEAKSYLKLSQDFDLTQEEIAKKLGKSRSVVANKLRLLTLPVEIQKALSEGRITEGHAKAILAIPNPEKQRGLFEIILKNGLTVRQTENKTREISVKPHKRNIAVDPEVKEVEEKLSSALGTKVKVSRAGKGGRIVVEYYSDEELEAIVGKISVN